MLPKTGIAALILGASTLLSPLTWAQDAESTRQDKVHSTQSVKSERVDRSDWISFKDALKRLEEEGHAEIISLTQTRHGYYARSLNKDGNVEHIIIHPTEGTLRSKDASELRHSRHGKMYRSHGSRMHKGPGSGPHHGKAHPHHRGKHKPAQGGQPGPKN